MGMEETEPEILYPGSKLTPYGGGSGSGRGEGGKAGTPPVKVQTSNPDRQRIAFNQLTFSAMRQNPVYALFVITFLYWIYRLLVTILYPVVRPPILDFFSSIYHGMGSPFQNVPFFGFLCTVLDLIHRLFERVIYPIVCVQILDRVFVVILVIILCMFVVWLIWKYTLVWPVKDILGTILQNTPPFSWAWGFFDRLEAVIFGDNTARLKALADFIASGFGLISDEGQARMENSSGTNNASSVSSVSSYTTPTVAAEDPHVATLRLAVRSCDSRYTPYDFTDPFSQIMVRTELTKCKIDGLEAYMTTAEPEVATKMKACRNQAALFAPSIPQAEFVPTAMLVNTISAAGNVTSVDAEGMRTVKHGASVVARQVDSAGVTAVLDPSGNALGYLDGSQERVMLDNQGHFVAVSTNLQQVLNTLSRTDQTFAPGSITSDPMVPLLTGSDAYLQCQLDVLKTSAVNVRAELTSCADGEEPVPDPELSWTDISGSVTNAKQFSKDASASQARVGACQNKKGTDFAKLE